MAFLVVSLLLLSMFMTTMSCHVDDFDSIELVILWILQIWECPLNWFIMCTNADICHRHGLGATYPKHVVLVDPQVQMIPN